MTKTKNKLVHLLFVVLLTCTVSLANAQGPGGPGGPGPDPDPGTSVPFDGGLSLVVAAGIAYAAKKGYDKKAQARKEKVEK